MNYLIRPATREDIPAIIKIVNSGNNRVAFGWVRKVVLEYAISEQENKGNTSKDLLEVATSVGKVVGFSRIYHRNDGITRLHEIGVAEAVQGSGVGSALMVRAMRSSRRHGQKLFRVLTPSNLRSNDFYRKHGLKLVGDIQNKKKTKTLNIYEIVLH